MLVLLRKIFQAGYKDTSEKVKNFTGILIILLRRMKHQLQKFLFFPMLIKNLKQ